MKSSMDKVRSLSAGIQIGMTADALPFEAWKEALYAVHGDYEQFKDVVLDRATDEATEFSASLEATGSNAALGEWADQAWEKTVADALEQLESAYEVAHEALPDLDATVDADGLAAIRSFEFSVIAVAEEFPEELRF